MVEWLDSNVILGRHLTDRECVELAWYMAKNRKKEITREELDSLFPVKFGEGK